MPDKHQFTLKWLLVEVVLMAAFLRLLTWNLPRDLTQVTSVHVILWVLVGLPTCFAMTGAFFGGLFGRFVKGAVIGGLVYVVFWLLLLVIAYPLILLQ